MAEMFRETAGVADGYEVITTDGEQVGIVAGVRCSYFFALDEHRV